MGYRRGGEKEEFLVAYVQALTDKDIQRLGIMYKQNLCGDKRRICEFLSLNQDMDDWLVTSVNCQDLYDMVSWVGEFVREEHHRRADIEDEKRGQRDTAVR
jgi:hypothetical protein